MKEHEQTSPKQGKAVWDLAEFGFDIAGDIVGEFGFSGFVLYLAITLPIVLIRTFLD